MNLLDSHLSTKFSFILFGDRGINMMFVLLFLLQDSIDRSESSMQEESYGSLCEDDHFMCIAICK